MRILHLTLKRQFFDMIASGEKKEEYRDVKPFWVSRLVGSFGHPYSCADFNFEWKGMKFSMDTPKHYDQVCFKNGYSKDCPEMLVEVVDIDINQGQEKWGAELGKPYFIIKLGKILSIKNYNK